MNQVLSLTEKQFEKVTDKIKECQNLRDDRENKIKLYMAICKKCGWSSDPDYGTKKEAMNDKCFHYDMTGHNGKVVEWNGDPYDLDKPLRLWLDIESELENFLDRLGYEFNHIADRFIYKKKDGPNW